MGNRQAKEMQRMETRLNDLANLYMEMANELNRTRMEIRRVRGGLFSSDRPFHRAEGAENQPFLHELEEHTDATEC